MFSILCPAGKVQMKHRNRGRRVLLGLCLACAGLTATAGAQDRNTGRFTLAEGPARDIAYPALKPLAGHDDPVLAYNLASIRDWSPQMPFIDVMKTAREWIGALPGQWDGWTEDQLRAGGYLDENGWVAALPPELEQIRAVFAWEENAHGAGEARAGTYELTYKGTGTLEMMFVPASEILAQEPGRIVFEIGPDQGNWGFVIRETDPERSGDHIRDIRIVNRRHAALYDAGAIFNPDWLQHVRDARMVRFATWANTSNSDMTRWAEMPSAEHYSWTTVPVEIMVRLANEIGADPWFSLPFHADDDFARRMAEYVQLHLDPRLMAHVELSNEVWNQVFLEAQWSREAAVKLWGLSPEESYVGAASFYGKRAAEIMDIWTDVFGEEAGARLVRVAGTHSVNPWLSEQILRAPVWRDHDPAGYAPPHRSFDALSPTLYFGGEAVVEEDLRAGLLAALKDPAVDGFDYHYRLIRGEIGGAEGGLPRVLGALQDQAAVARKYGLRLVPYEGGQHVHHSAFIDIPEADLFALQDHLVGFVRSDRMAELYGQLWQAWRRIGSGPFMQYTDIGAASRYGSWGLRASNSDNPPRAVLVDLLNAQGRAWWEDRGGAQFRQGHTDTGTQGADTMAGSEAEDYLIGRAGDDTFYPGPGDDGVNGGPGKDRVLFAGPRRAYEVAAAGDRLIVTGPDGRDRLFAVEELVFSDVTVTVSQAGAE